MEDKPISPTSRMLCVAIQNFMMCIAEREPHKADFCEHICVQLEREFPEPPEEAAEGTE
ncbi:hypothetical protein [Azospirillum himalayense]|uniref:Uncharacterized protein n=1 Tax=Azospirillum himalayense TaxID=654847 RepID=A0ABW0FXX9_9PROT